MVFSRVNPLTQTETIPLNLDDEQGNAYYGHLERRVQAASEFHRQ